MTVRSQATWVAGAEPSYWRAALAGAMPKHRAAAVNAARGWFLWTIGQGSFFRHCLSRSCQLCLDNSPSKAQHREGSMTHWRKPLPAFRLNPFALWTIGMWVVLATLVLVARHGYI
jgi:hypothetical protein